MSFFFAILVSVACIALVIALVGFAVFVWLQVFDDMEGRRDRKRRRRESSF
jgi:hypothetical protein